MTWYVFGMINYGIHDHFKLQIASLKVKNSGLFMLYPSIGHFISHLGPKGLPDDLVRIWYDQL